MKTGGSFLVLILSLLLAVSEKRALADPIGVPVVVTATAGTVGPTTYGTLGGAGGAFAAINNGTHQGDITINILSPGTIETGPAILNGSGAGAASYTSVLIRPVNDGVSVAGPTAAGRGLIELNGASNVTIDGDNPNTSGINRNLTLQNTAANTVTFTSVIRIALATSAVTTANNNTFKNLNIVGSSPGRNIGTATTTTGTENTTFGFFAGPGASTTDPTAPPSAITSISTGIGSPATAGNLIIHNDNFLPSVARAISINGSATSVFPGLRVRDNFIGNSSAGSADQVTAIGITVQGSTDAVIAGNTIHVEGYIPASASTHGINVGVNNSAVSGAVIEKNMIRRVRNNHPNTWSTFGINLGGGNNHVVRNNFVFDVRNDQTTGTGAFNTLFGAMGIRINSGTGHKIYFNSVHLFGTIPGSTSTDLTMAFGINATSLTGCDVRNNIFSNQLSGGNPNGNNTRHACVFLPSGGTNQFDLTWNNNAYYQGPATTGALSLLAQVGTSAGSGQYFAADFNPGSVGNPFNLRTYTSTLLAAGTNDNVSFGLAAGPPVVSDTDLHIPVNAMTQLAHGAAPGTGVVDDIDNEARDPVAPDIGADEFSLKPAPTPTPTPTPSPTPPCTTGADGLLYALNDDSSGSFIYGFRVNEATGALTPLPGFPVAAQNGGINSIVSERLVADEANLRLYAVNDSSDTVSAYSINPATGALSPMPFSPISLGSGVWNTIAVHPSGSPLVVANNATNGLIHSFAITSTTATPAPGSPYNMGAGVAGFSSRFSTLGAYYYVGGNIGNNIGGFSVDSATGMLTPLSGSPFDSGAANPLAYAVDVTEGRLFVVDNTNGIRSFASTAGMLTPATGNPFPSGLSARRFGIVHPNGHFYMVAGNSGNNVGVFQISGSGVATTLAPVAGSPFVTGGTTANALAANVTGSFLYLANRVSRNITTFGVNTDTGGLTILSVQPSNTLRALGAINGIAYVAVAGGTCPTSVFSRKVHGGAGAFDIELPLTGGIGIECRTGPAFQMIVNFATNVTVESASVTSGTGMVNSFTGNGTPMITVNLSGVTNAQQITVTLHNVNDGTSTGNVPISMDVLAGDTNANGAVNSADVAQTKARLGQALDATNFRSDVNANGAINAGDVSQIKSLLGTGLP